MNTEGRNVMNKALQRILSILCALAMLLGCMAALAESATEADDLITYVISAQWNDEDDYDGIRPAYVTASVGDATVTLSEGNGWIAEAKAPEGSAWSVSGVDGYAMSASGSELATVSFSHLVRRVSQSVSVIWDDNNDAAGLRPDSVVLNLLADGALYTTGVASARNGWTVSWSNLPLTAKGNPNQTISYSLSQGSTPKGYTTAISGATVTNTLQTGHLSLAAAVSGVPEGADVSSLSLTVTGPDPRMPITLTYGQLAGGFDFGNVIPGAYVVQENNADSLVEGYEPGPGSTAGNAVLVSPGGSSTLDFAYHYQEITEKEPNENPEDSFANLVIDIIGPDFQKTVTYADFVNGVYELEDIPTGSYAVIERNAENLVDAYMLTSDSVTGVTLKVEKEGATARLYNKYVPAPTPEPEEEFIDIPVTKTWVDNNNQDGNRPASVTVSLLANGTEVATAELSEGSGWAATFAGMPVRDEEGNEILYTVSEAPVEWYVSSVSGYDIINTYTPEYTTATVSKVWNDDNDAQKIRPTSIAVTLLPIGKVYILSAANNWTLTANQLPTRINGEPAVYSWAEQETLYYVADGATVNGDVTTLNNRITRVPEIPQGYKPPKVPTNEWTIFEEYDTALGMELLINHVGDCFD